MGLPQNDEMTKVPAGWFIEKCGFKGYRKGDAGVHEKQALVLVNYGKANGTELLDLARSIQDKVRNTYGIDLIPEVKSCDFKSRGLQGSGIGGPKGFSFEFSFRRARLSQNAPFHTAFGGSIRIGETHAAKVTI